MEEDTETGLLFSSMNAKLKRKNKLQFTSKYQKVWTRARYKVLAYNEFLSIYCEVKKCLNRNSAGWLLGTEYSQHVRSHHIRSSDFQTQDYINENPCIINPDSSLKFGWNLVISFALLYTATIMPYSTVFLETGQFDSWFIIEIILDSLFFLDIIINLNTGFYNADGFFIRKRFPIFLNYLKSWFIIDIVSCIPFGYIGSSSEIDSNATGYRSLLKVLRVPKFYKLFRISRIIKLFKHYKNTEILEKIQDFFSIKQSVMRFSTTIIGIFVCVHIISCFWYYIAKMTGESTGTWVFELKLLDEDNVSIYITSLYWAISSLSTVGYGDIHAFSNLERIFSICWMLFGVYFLSFVIGSLTAMLNNMDTKESILASKLAAIDEFAKETMMEKSVKIRLQHAIKYSTEKSGFSWNDKQSIFNELPRILRHEISFAMHGGAARNLDFFQEKDPAIISAIVPFLVPVFVKTDNFVYRKGEYSEEIYFVVKGKMNYMDEEDRKVLRSILSGRHFGEIEVVLKVERVYSVKAYKNSELLMMNKFILGVVEKEYPAVWKCIRNDALVSEISNRKAEIEAEEGRMLNSGIINFKEYKKNIERKFLEYKGKAKIQFARHRNKDKTSLEYLQREVKSIHFTVESLKEMIKNLQE